MNILLVEDEAKVARFVTRSLEAEGHTVHTVEHAGEAEAALTVSAFDLIILDLMLPGVDGVTFCRAQRARANRTPILILTARDSVEDRVLGLESGADDYLVKPFALEELLARVRALLRRSSQGGAHELRTADLTVDTRSRRVRRGERETRSSAAP
jgi:DNA-binding response OmpR family regulator